MVTTQNNNDSLVSFTEVVDFEKECIGLSNDFLKLIPEIGQIELSDSAKLLTRASVLVFVQGAISFFVERCEFIISLLGREEPKEKKEILRTLIRGMIEIYCRLLYLNKIDDTEKVKKIVWHDLYLTALVARDKQIDNSVKALLDLNYKLLQQFKIPFPAFADFIQGVQEDLNSLGNRNIRKYNDYNFPTVRSIIKNYFDEGIEPKINKIDLYYFYSLFSEQIHSNFMLEYSSANVDPKYPLMALILQLHLRLLREVANFMNQNQSEVNNLVDRYNLRIRGSLALLWKNSRQVSQ